TSVGGVWQASAQVKDDAVFWHPSYLDGGWPVGLLHHRAHGMGVPASGCFGATYDISADDQYIWFEVSPLPPAGGGSGGPADYRMRFNNPGHPNLTAFYDMSTLISGKLMDLSGNANHGTINGNPTYVAPLIAPKRTKCMDFDGAADFVAIPNPISGLTEFSIAVWINSDASFKMIWSRAADDDMYFYLNPTLNLAFQVVNAFTTPGHYPLNQTYMLVVTYDNTISCLYVNGPPVVNNYVLGANPADVNAFIGQWWDGSLKFEGRLDNMMFFDKALSASD
ncbi:unnamed protein product, partial [marine sediment metagenome]